MHLRAYARAKEYYESRKKDEKADKAPKGALEQQVSDMTFDLVREKLAQRAEQE